MGDLISRRYAITMIENHILRKKPELEDSQLIQAYKAGFRDAMQEAKMELEDVPSKYREDVDNNA